MTARLREKAAFRLTIIAERETFSLALSLDRELRDVDAASKARTTYVLLHNYLQ